MKTQRKPTMTREQAEELYKDLHKAMSTMMDKKKGIAKGGAASAKPQISAAAKAASAAKAYGLPKSVPVSQVSAIPGNRGHHGAIALVLVFAIVKIGLSALEASGFATAASAQAVMQSAPQVVAPAFGRDELKILTSLDSRRAELEDKNKKLDSRQEDLDKREKELVTNLTQLREMTDKLSAEREKSEKKNDNQLEQLANVYGSMTPTEAAQLIDQLDITIAMALVQRMPEKRLGQILAAMNKERALAITKMLSGR